MINLYFFFYSHFDSRGLRHDRGVIINQIPYRKTTLAQTEYSIQTLSPYFKMLVKVLQ
jgi:hypothetical protein